MSDISLSMLGAFLFETEQSLDLLNWRCDGVYPWPLIRLRLFNLLLERSGLTGHVYMPKSKSLGVRKESLKRIANLFYGNLHIHTPRRGSVLIPHERKVAGADPISAALQQSLGTDVLVVDHSPQPGSGAYNLKNFLNVSRYIYRRPCPESRQPIPVMEELKRRIAERFSADISDLLGTLPKLIRRFRAEMMGWQKLFERSGAHTLYTVCSWPSAVGAAQAVGLRVIELQHGAMTHYHMGYSWPNTERVPYFPDELWCFGSFWPETTPLPTAAQWRVIGTPDIPELRDFDGSAKDPRLAVFISSGPSRKELTAMAVEAARQCPDKEILVRLHPSESLEQFEAMLQGVDVPANFRLSLREEGTYPLLARASFQIGVSSTTLFEGMVLRNRVLVPTFPGHEYLLPSVNRGDAILIRNSQECIEALRDPTPTCKDPSSYYAPPVNDFSPFLSDGAIRESALRP